MVWGHLYILSAAISLQLKYLKYIVIFGRAFDHLSMAQQEVRKDVYRAWGLKPQAFWFLNKIFGF